MGFSSPVPAGVNIAVPELSSPRWLARFATTVLISTHVLTYVLDFPLGRLIGQGSLVWTRPCFIFEFRVSDFVRVLFGRDSCTSPARDPRAPRDTTLSLVGLSTAVRLPCRPQRSNGYTHKREEVDGRAECRSQGRARLHVLSCLTTLLLPDRIRDDSCWIL